MLENGLVDPKVDNAPEVALEPGEVDESAQGEKREQPKQADPQSLARFLKNCPRLDKKVLGEYISHLENPELLKEFIGLFDFRGVSRETKGLRFILINRAETDRGSHERVIGVVQAARGGSANCKDYRNVCKTILCLWPTCVKHRHLNLTCWLIIFSTG